MIVKAFYRTREDGVNLYRTFSTESLQIHKVGTDEVYDEAIDVENLLMCMRRQTSQPWNKPKSTNGRVRSPIF